MIRLLVLCLFAGLAAAQQQPKKPFDLFLAHPNAHAWPNSYLLAKTSKYAAMGWGGSPRPIRIVNRTEGPVTIQIFRDTDKLLKKPRTETTLKRGRGLTEQLFPCVVRVIADGKELGTIRDVCGDSTIKRDGEKLNFEQTDKRTLTSHHEAVFAKRMRAMGMRRIDWVMYNGKGFTTRAAVVSNDAIIVVVFHGWARLAPKETIDAWITGPIAMLLIKDGRYGNSASIHAGFRAGLEGMRERIAKLVRSHGIGEGKSLWLTGHGMGGALATIGAVAVSRAGFNVRGVYTYGAPRAGDQAFATAFKSRGIDCQRWVNNNDLIATVPPDVVVGYRHVGRLNTIRKDGFIRLDYKDSRAVGDIKSHPIDLYIAAIGKALPDQSRKAMDLK